MFLSLRAEVEDALEGALAELDFPTDDLGIEEPPDDVESVLASSVAFRLAGEAGAAPPQVQIGRASCRERVYVLV